MNCNRTLAHADFYIGLEFFIEVGRWRCTDVGTRTICAISLEPRKIVSLSVGEAPVTRIASDPSWLQGPPFMVAEQVFDETSFGALYAFAMESS